MNQVRNSPVVLSVPVQCQNPRRSSRGGSKVLHTHIGPQSAPLLSPTCLAVAATIALCCSDSYGHTIRRPTLVRDGKKQRIARRTYIHDYVIHLSSSEADGWEFPTLCELCARPLDKIDLRVPILCNQTPGNWTTTMGRVINGVLAT